MRDYEDREPEITLEIWLVPHGYQMDTYVEGQKIGSACRDYSRSKRGSHHIHIQAVLDEIDKAFKRVEQRTDEP